MIDNQRNINIAILVCRILHENRNDFLPKRVAKLRIFFSIFSKFFP